MIKKYLPEFYTFKVLSPRTPVRIMEPSNDLEKQIHKLILDGNSAFFKGQYQTALSYYLTAWSLYPKLVVPGLRT